jgi:hypothetical protein
LSCYFKIKTGEKKMEDSCSPPGYESHFDRAHTSVLLRRGLVQRENGGDEANVFFKLSDIFKCGE